MSEPLPVPRRLPYKDEREAWREAARRIYGGHGLTVPQHANVSPSADGGAFVEAVVWVPSLDVPEPIEAHAAGEANPVAPEE